MALSIYSTLSRTQAPFAPIEPNHVRMYVCGVTVYDYCHIGHGRTFVAFDVVRRWLEASGMKVTFVRNITDVDDKIIRRAAERGITTTELTEEFGRAMQELSLIHIFADVAQEVLDRAGRARRGELYDDRAHVGDDLDARVAGGRGGEDDAGKAQKGGRERKKDTGADFHNIFCLSWFWVARSPAQRAVSRLLSVLRRRSRTWLFGSFTTACS